MTSSADRVFAIPELFEHIFTYVLLQMMRVAEQENPRSVKTHANARVLLEILRCSRVNWTWYRGLRGSSLLQSFLFLAHRRNPTRSDESEPRRPALVLNPVIQDTFPSYNFRLCRETIFGYPERFYGFMIITKRYLPAIKLRSLTFQGLSISSMFLTQPPCTAIEASIYEERDESKEYVGRTFHLRDPIIECEQGVTLELVHRRVTEMFAEHSDVSAIKLTTVSQQHPVLASNVIELVP